MTTRDIIITENAYDRLAAHRHRDNSFSDPVARLTEDANPMAFTGCPVRASVRRSWRPETSSPVAPFTEYNSDGPRLGATGHFFVETTESSVV